MIENSDRGITLAKPLAWTILSGLVVAGIWIGQTSGELQTELGAVAKSLAGLEASQALSEARDREDRRSFEDRLRAVETSRVQDTTELNALRRELTTFREELQEATDLLRTAIQTNAPVRTP